MNRSGQEDLWKAARSDAGRQREWMLRKTTFAVLCLVGLFVLLLAGCGDLTSGGYGEVEVSVVSDPHLEEEIENAFLTLIPSQEDTSAPPLSTAWNTGGLALDSGDLNSTSLSDVISAAEGRLRFRTRIFLRRGARGWIEVTPGLQERSLSLHTGEEEVLATTQIPTGRYDAVRVDFRFVEAEVDRGLMIQGDTIQGPIAVALPSGGLSLLFLQRVVVLDGRKTSLALELRAQAWLRRANRGGRFVRREDFEREVRLEVRR